MHDLATALSNDTSMVDQDVTDIFELEKEIAKVRSIQLALVHTRRFHLARMDTRRTTCASKSDPSDYGW